MTRDLQQLLENTFDRKRILTSTLTLHFFETVTDIIGHFLSL